MTSNTSSLEKSMPRLLLFPLALRSTDEAAADAAVNQMRLQDCRGRHDQLLVLSGYANQIGSADLPYCCLVEPDEVVAVPPQCKPYSAIYNVWHTFVFAM